MASHIRPAGAGDTGGGSAAATGDPGTDDAAQSGSRRIVMWRMLSTRKGSLLMVRKSKPW